MPPRTPSKSAPAKAAAKSTKSAATAATKAAATAAAKRSMSDSHKQALAHGREQGHMVRRYVDALEASKPKRGRKRSSDAAQKRLEQVEAELAGATGMERLHLIQERIDLQASLGTAAPAVDMGKLEADFIAAAKEYGARKGITYAAWREAGVPASVLKKAGIASR